MLYNYCTSTSSLNKYIVQKMFMELNKLWIVMIHEWPNQLFSDDYCTKPVVCRMASVWSSPGNGGGYCFFSYNPWVSVTNYRFCLCFFVCFLALLQFALPFGSYFSSLQGASSCLQWDNLQYTCTSALTAQLAHDCVRLRLCFPIEFLVLNSHELLWGLKHSWWRWLFESYASSCYRLLDTSYLSTTDKILYVHQSELMQLSSSLGGLDILNTDIFKTFWFSQ